MPQSFAQLVNKNTRILILGTMPGEASLKAQEYYAHPRNIFWRIMADIFNAGAGFADYQAKTQCLLSHNVGLWDNLQYCERQGSLDSDIRREIPNDIETLLAANPQIDMILCNGQKSYDFFKKYHQPLLKSLNCQIMPSTSPANARLSYAQKLAAWCQALQPEAEDK